MARRRPSRSALALLSITVTAAATALAGVATPAAAAPPRPAPVRHVTRASLENLAHSEAHLATRSADAAAVRHAGRRGRTVPTFSSSYTVDGVVYPYTMLGAAPPTGRTARLKTVLVPLRMTFTGFTQDHTFEPWYAVGNMLGSPIYHRAAFRNGRGQFPDQFQRAEFWNRMDRARRWHTLLTAEVSRPFTITVTPDTGQLGQLDDGALIGNMNIDAFDTQLRDIMAALHLDADETPLFVTQGVTADALGYHDAFAVPDGHGGDRAQTYMWSSWLDPADVGALIGDVSTLNHEVQEWIDDPFVNNAAPLWAYPPFNEVCADNPFLEVGDPQGNGPDYALFPTVVVPLHGYTYHLQDLALLQWFSRETPSSAYHGWYAFPDPTQLPSPSVPCQP
jgi:hypothetical protein